MRLRPIHTKKMRLGVEIELNPETRRLIKVLPSDVRQTAEVFDLLLGDNLSGRKTHIAENGWRYIDLIDVS